MAIKVKPAVTQMNGGQIAPIMESRTDVQIYPYSLRKELNCMPLVYGANRNRGGSAFVYETKNNGKEKAALVPFKVGQNVAYILEFGEGYIRFYKNRERIYETIINGESVYKPSYEVETPYAAEDLFDEKGVFLLDYVQSGDVLYLVHEKYPPKKLMRYGDKNWRLQEMDISGGPWGALNLDENVKFKADGVLGNVGVYCVGFGDYTQCYVSPPELNKDTVFIPEIKCSVVVSGAMLQFDASSFGLDQSDYGLCAMIKNAIDLNGGEDWTADIIPAGNSFQCLIKTRNKECAGQAVQVQFYQTKAFSGDTVVTVSESVFGEYIVSKESFFTPAMVGRKIRLRRPESAEVNVWYAGKEEVKEGDLVQSDGCYYRAKNGGTCGSVKPTHKEGVVSDGHIYWQYLHAGYGYGVITKYIDSLSVQMEVKERLPDEVVNSGTYKWELGLLGEDGIWPCCTEFFKDRLLLGFNGKQGPQVCFSCSGDYENFSDMTNGEVLASNAIVLPILSDMNRITWFCAQDSLFVGTEGGIVSVKPMTSSEVLGPDNITYDNISSVGTCRIKPIKIGDDVLYLGRLAKDIYAIAYNWQSDSYEPDEISLTAYNLLDKGIASWCLQYEPDRIIWAVRGDGKLVGLTYNKRQQVRAFHLHETQGAFENIACIPAPDGTIDEVYFVAKRKPGNFQSRCIEFFKNGLELNTPAGLDKAQELEYLFNNAWYLDSAARFNFDEPAIKVQDDRLLHLDGAKVCIFADGKLQKNKTVNGTTVNLDVPAKNILVGLAYESVIELMPINIDMQDGTGQARSQRINALTARLYRSADFKFSHDSINWTEARVLKDEERTLKSGDLFLNWSASNSHSGLNTEDIVNATGARMLFKQDKPLPVCFTAFYPQMEVSSD